MQIFVKFESFLDFQNKYGTTYLDKKNRYNLYSSSKGIIRNNFNKLNEIFNGIQTQYKISERKNGNYLITFTTNSGNEYRIDLILDSGIYHIAFSLSNYNLENYEYEKLTELNESKEVFARMAYILKELSKEKNIKEFCIGGTGNPKKDRIYEYIMKYVSKWEKRKDTSYEMGWALYFTM